MSSNPAVAAIAFALEDDDGIEFLRYWNEGEFDILRRNWPDAPEEVYIDADHTHPQSAPLGDRIYVRMDDPQTDAEKLANAILIEADARGALKTPIFSGGAATVNTLTSLVKLMCVRPPETTPTPVPDYSFVYNDWRDDRCALYGPAGCIASSLTPHQARQLKDYFVREANLMRERVFGLPRFALDEGKRGAYEHYLGSYVTFKSARDLFETPIIQDTPK